MTDLDDVANRLGGPALAPIVDELARRLGEGRGMPARITLRRLSDDTRRAIADLLGVARLPPADTRVEVARLTDALGISDQDDLRKVVARLHGPLEDRAAERIAERRAREALWDWFTSRCRTSVVPNVGPLRHWPMQVRKDGIRGDLDAHRARLARAFDVLSALDQVPPTGVPLAAFANLTLGDSHGLDDGQPLARLVLAAIADAAGEPRPMSAEDARGLWELVGVNPDPLSSNVLAIGLDAGVDHPLASILAHHRAAAEPIILTLSQLKRWPVDPLPAHNPAFIVENPAIVAAAAATGWQGPPIICSSGRPSIAVVTLIRQLGSCGAALRQHADFDVAGLGITTWLAGHADTTPWLMTAADYHAAVASERGRPRLSGALPATPWDPALADAMEHHGQAVYEEELTDQLLARMLGV
jgi:uncharacterized protein (TIGR02679 family)